MTLNWTNRVRARHPALAASPALLLACLGIAAPSPASAAVSAETCSGTQASIPDGYAKAGQWIVVENNGGERNPKYGTTTNFTGVPLCAVRMTDARTPSQPQWIFCTQASLYACGQDAMGAAEPSSKLSPLHRSEIAWAIATGRLDGPVSRALVQTDIWCVTDRVERNRTNAQIIADARAYFADKGITLPAGTNCPDWSAVDPTLRSDPRLLVRSTQPQVSAGGDAVFEVSTNLPDLDVNATAEDGSPLPVRVCPGEERASLRTGALAVSGTSNARTQVVRLCVRMGAPGSVRLAATAGEVFAKGLTSIRSTRAPSACQLMVTTTGERLTAAASAVATAPVPVPRVATPPPPADTSIAGPPTASLVVTKRLIGARRVRSGQRVSWRIRLVNRGTTAAVGVVVCDKLGRGLAVVATTPAVRPVDGRICWAVASLAPQRGRTFRIRTRVTLQPTATRCHRITNRVTASGREVSPARGSASVRVCHRRRPPQPGGTTG